MERIVTATEANREFSRILGEVAEGHTYVITTRGKQVARLEPSRKRAGELDAKAAARRKADWDAFMEELKARPASNLPRWSREDGYE